MPPFRFPTGDFAWRLGLRPTDPAAWLLASDGADERLRAERRGLFAQVPERCLIGDDPAAVAVLARALGRAGSDLSDLGASVTADLLVLDRHRRLRCGAICWPTGWAPERVVGRSVDAIHAVVPGLNAAIGPGVARTLDALVPGRGFSRYNWGLSAVPDRDLHPARAIPPPTAADVPERLWLRVEDQLLTGLDEEFILFAIRVAITPLAVVAATDQRAALARQLRTMPPAVRAYKGLSAVAEPLVAWLTEKTEG